MHQVLTAVRQACAKGWECHARLIFSLSPDSEERVNAGLISVLQVGSCIW